MISVNLAAAGLYLLVVIGCLGAAVVAVPARSPRWHRIAWIGLTALFAILILSRFYGLEEALMAELRSIFRGDNSYGRRRDVQALSATLLLAVVAVIGGAIAFRRTPLLRGRRDQVTAFALVSGGAMLLLIALRVISLHAIDRLLYGALKLNWVGDIGASFAVIAAATYYILRSRGLR